MKIVIETPDGIQSIPIPGSFALQLLAGQIPNEAVREYLKQPGRCRALCEELERCAAHFPHLRLAEVFPSKGGSLTITLEV